MKNNRKKILLKEAQKLSKSINKNPEISVDEILKEITIVRRKKANKKALIPSFRIKNFNGYRLLRLTMTLP